MLNVVVLFVFTEAIPKTWAVLHSEQAAMVTARPTLLVVQFWPLRLITQGLIGLANWILPGKGIKGGRSCPSASSSASSRRRPTTR